MIVWTHPIPTRPSPGQPLAVPGSDVRDRNPPWEVLMPQSQWWHWVAYAVTGHLGGERDWESVPPDVWRSIHQACHPQFTWRMVARLLRLTSAGATSNAWGTPSLPPITGLFNLWVRAEYGFRWRPVGRMSDLHTLLALRSTCRLTLRDLCCTPPRPSLQREIVMYRSATRAWLKGVMDGAYRRLQVH